MIYILRPYGEVSPVSVQPEATMEDLVDGLEACGLFADGLLDPAWFLADGPAEAAGDRLAAARRAYVALLDSGDVAAGPGPGNPASRDAVAAFFAFVAETGEATLTIDCAT
jgi:hypothetical protein